MTDPGARLSAVYDATTRYLQDLDALTSETVGEPSTLPGWTRGHVVAHVARHALGLARAFDGAARGESVPVYDSQPQRDSDIQTTSELPLEELREHSFDSCGRWRESVEGVIGRDVVVERVPGGPRLSLDEAIEARRREVEIHHADLLVGYGPNDWPEEFLDTVFNTVVEDRQDGPPMLLRTPHGDVLIGNGYGPAVGGDRAELTWWLLGRGAGEGLTCDGELPTLGPWTRRTRAR